MAGEVQREREIFNRALELGSLEERAQYLSAACGKDLALLARVRALLDAYAEADGLFSSPPQQEGGADPVSIPEPLGLTIGRYKLVERIGEGGMGAVYVAEQTEPVARRVALKIIKQGMDTERVMARFEAERQALALMEHPNIARVLDAGATDAGRPFFVMELVPGTPITRYCDQNRLTLSERLNLFLPLCHAVQHAHQKGVIHRDLKPTNVLVMLCDGVPVPKIIDFGIAKATDRPLTDKPLHTRPLEIMGTPAYMSPEQAGWGRGDVDTRADVYSLGVVLYELLTGKTPFDAGQLAQAGVQAARKQILEAEPPTPSTKVRALTEPERTVAARHRGASPRQLDLLLRGDLDWILMKALQKDRTRRYSSADALADDLGHFLRHEPVSAAAPTAWYLLFKFIRRHAALFNVLAAFAVALWLVGLGGCWVRRETRNLRTLASVSGVVNASPDGVRNVIETLRPQRTSALKPLIRVVEEGRLEKTPMTARQRFNATLALASYGDVRGGRLLEWITTATARECPEVIRYLAQDRARSLENIAERIAAGPSAGEKARLATLALHLGQPEHARRLLLLRTNPLERTAFIHGYASWHGDLDAVAQMLREVKAAPESAHLRSGLCAALALIPWDSLSPPQQTNLSEVASELYADSPDGGTHGAAFCALTKWSRPILTEAPTLQATNRPPPNRQWYVNSLGVTLLKVPAGQFQMGDDGSIYSNEKPRHTVTLTQPFWISDREVTVELFRRFVADTDYAGGKPDDWESAFEEHPRPSPTPECPVHSAAWEDAVPFCNWLTWKEWGNERPPTYRRRDDGAWERDLDARGYRLPTEAEWEYVCRAGSETDYCYGDSRTLLMQYCVYFTNSDLRSWPAGGKLPNGWGVFDMHGNLWEWCDDWYGDYLVPAEPDPRGPATGQLRPLRGGSWPLGEYFVRSAVRLGHGPGYHSDHVGFRVVVPAASD